MAKDFSKAFYNSSAWWRFRNAYILARQVEDGGMCEACHKNPGVILHHMILLDEDNINDAHATLDDSKVAFVCERCHNAIHEVDRGRGCVPIAFDEDGDILNLSEFITRK